MDPRVTPSSDIIRRAPRSFNPPARIEAVAAAHCVTQHDLMTKMNKRQGIIRGEVGHMYVDRMKFKVAAGYSERCCIAMRSSLSTLLIEPLTISLPGQENVHARCGSDTMASVSVISGTFVTQTLLGGRPDTNFIVKYLQCRKVNGSNSSILQ